MAMNLAQALHMWQNYHKIMPQLVSDKQHKQNTVNMSQNLSGKVERLTVSSKIIKGDGKWVYRYDPATKKQSSGGNSPSARSLKKARHFVPV